MPSYCEFVIKGQPGWTLGFIQGYVVGSGEAPNVLDAEAEGFQCESLRERLREFLLRSSDTLHLVVQADLASRVQQAVAEAVKMGRRAKIVHSQEIHGARFSFTATVYSKKHGDKIREMFRDPPEGVKIEGQMNVKVDPEAKGVEMYAPAHDYELRAECEVSGPIDGVLRLHRLARGEDLIQLGDLELLRGERSD